MINKYMKPILHTSLLLIFLLIGKWACMAQNEYKEISNLAYLPAEKIEVDSLQRLNLIIPTEAEKPPLLVWIGAGAWSFVNRHQEMDFARMMGKEGVAVASVGH